MPSFIVELSALVTLLISLVFIYELLENAFSRYDSGFRSYGMGVVFGAFTLINMTTPIHLVEGVLFGARPVMLIIASAFGGWQAGLITATMAAVYRFFLGGVDVPTSIGAIYSCALVGVWFYRSYPSRVFSMRTLGAMSGAAILMTLVWMLFIPDGSGWEIVRQIWFPVALVYPLGILVIGILLSRHQQQRSTRAALAEGERRFRAIFNNTFQFTGLMRPDGTLIEINQTALDFGGLTRKDVLGRPFWEARWWAISRETQERLQRAIRDAARGDFVRYEVDMLGEGTRIITIDFSIKPVLDEAGRVTMLIPEARDISDRKVAEQRERELAIERERITALESFVKDTSHDLRTPVTVIYSSTSLISMALMRIRHNLNQMIEQPELTAACPNAHEILVDTYRYTDKINERLPTVEQNVTRLRNTVTEISEMVRAESNWEYRLYPTDLSKAVSRTIRSIQPLAEQKQIHFNHSLQPALPSVMIDPVRFDHVVQNLVVNAITYTQEGGRVDVRTACTDRHVLFEVRDNGMGIEADDLPHIFERFYRSDHSLSEHSDGAGLGLAIVKQVVDFHKGEIEVESKPGLGSTFRVLLPIAAEPPPSETHLNGANGHSPAANHNQTTAHSFLKSRPARG